MEKSPLALQTDHAANIFGVQFMPCTNNRQIITGAMDDTVMLHNIERLPAQLARRGSGSPLPVAFQSTMFGCHRARVKVMSRFPVLSVCTQGACAGCIHGSEGCWPHVYEHVRYISLVWQRPYVQLKVPKGLPHFCRQHSRYRVSHCCHAS